MTGWATPQGLCRGRQYAESGRGGVYAHSSGHLATSALKVTENRALLAQGNAPSQSITSHGMNILGASFSLHHPRPLRPLWQHRERLFSDWVCNGCPNVHASHCIVWGMNATSTAGGRASAHRSLPPYIPNSAYMHRGFGGLQCTLPDGRNKNIAERPQWTGLKGQERQQRSQIFHPPPPTPTPTARLSLENARKTALLPRITPP